MAGTHHQVYSHIVWRFYKYVDKIILIRRCHELYFRYCYFGYYFYIGTLLFLLTGSRISFHLHPVSPPFALLLVAPTVVCIYSSIGLYNYFPSRFFISRFSYVAAHTSFCWTVPRLIMICCPSAKTHIQPGTSPHDSYQRKQHFVH